MKIVLAADGSKFTKKALAFLTTHEDLCGEGDELLVVNVQPAMPPRVRSLVGAAAVKAYHEEEAEKVLAPLRKLLERRGIAHRAEYKVGEPASQLLDGWAATNPDTKTPVAPGPGSISIARGWTRGARPLSFQLNPKVGQARYALDP